MVRKKCGSWKETRNNGGKAIERRCGSIRASIVRPYESESRYVFTVSNKSLTKFHRGTVYGSLAKTKAAAARWQGKLSSKK